MKLRLGELDKSENLLQKRQLVPHKYHRVKNPNVSEVGSKPKQGVTDERSYGSVNT